MGGPGSGGARRKDGRRVTGWLRKREKLLRANQRAARVAVRAAFAPRHVALARGAIPNKYFLHVRSATPGEGIPSQTGDVAGRWEKAAGKRRQAYQRRLVAAKRCAHSAARLGNRLVVARKWWARRAAWRRR